MLTATMLPARFTESYKQIMQVITPITYTESLHTPLPSVIPLHWLGMW